MSGTVLAVYKPEGLTPLQLIKSIKKDFSELRDEKIGYAGRLDPMASGVMLLMVGDENKNRKKYLGLDKEYEFEVLLGISSDSYDLLGIPSLGKNKFSLKKLKDYVNNLEGKITQTYPPFSGKTINGKKMFELAKSGELKSMVLPKISGEIKDVELIDVYDLSFGKVLKKVQTILPKIDGNFRQEEILECWENLVTLKKKKHSVARIKLACTSGIFVRSIAYDMGIKLSCGALTYSINRTRVENVLLEDCYYLKENIKK
ncbi:hypothetical protein ACFL1M_01515 [Patescibacteria group bacterium]